MLNKRRGLSYEAARALAIICCLMVMEACLFEGGSDTETGRNDTGTLEGLALDREGNPVSGVAVRLFKSGFDPFREPLSPVTVMTDDSGKYVFENLDADSSYNLLGKREADTTRAFRANLRPGDGPDTLRLDLPVRLEMTLEYVDYPYNTLDSTTAYFPGTDILFRCDTLTTVDTLPVGVVNLTVNNAQNEGNNAALPNNNGDWGGLPLGRGGDTIRVDVRKYYEQPYVITVLP